MWEVNRKEKRITKGHLEGIAGVWTGDKVQGHFAGSIEKA